MASKKPAAKSAKKLTIANRKKTPNQVKRKKAKASTTKRYAARAEKREAWKKANPDMIPGEIGKPATQKPVDEKAMEQAQEMLEAKAEASQDPDETVPGPNDEKTAIEVADELKFEDKLEAGVKTE